MPTGPGQTLCAGAAKSIVTGCSLSFPALLNTVLVQLEPAAWRRAGLTRQQCPWTLAPLADWDARGERRAAIWLARRVGRPLMRLRDSDYRAHSLQARPKPRT